MKQKIFFTLILTIAQLGLSISGVKANYMYGNGEPPRQIIVDKMVKPDRWENYEDNLSAARYVFVAENKVDYRILVKNSGEGELKNITVIDILPDFVNFLSASDGYVLNGKEVKWKIDQLKPGEEKTFEIHVQVVGGDQLVEKGDFCITNWVKAEAESGEKDEDTTQICIETRVLGAKELPEAGVDLVTLAAASLALTSLGFLFKKSEK